MCQEPYYKIMSSKLTFLKLTLSAFFTVIFIKVHSQTPVTRIYTDHNGFLMSSTSSIQSPSPSSQNLLAFQTGSTIWSTGVNDAILTANLVPFIPLDVKAMPATASGGNASALIGIGQSFGGYTGSNGCAPSVSPPFGGNTSNYLTDGPNGLDISTGIFNIGGTIKYTVSAINSSSIGDGIPDIIITQIGDINAGIWDQFRFKDASDNIVGNQVVVNFSGVNPVMRPLWKFYNLNTLACGASSTGQRATRVLAFEFSDLGITSANYANVTQFEHILTPNTDVAFIAYNTVSATILPISLVDFEAKFVDGEVKLNWTTASEDNSDYFVIERSLNGQDWEEVGTQKAATQSNSVIQYEDYDRQPYIENTSYYRLKMVDHDGSYSMSNIISVNYNREGLTVFPNPAKETLSITGKSIGEIRIIDITGKNVTDQTSFLNVSNNFVQLDIKNLTQGLYFVQCNNEVYQVVKN